MGDQKRTKLENAEIEKALTACPGWSLEAARPALMKRFNFKDFSAAWAFMAQSALLAEKMDHHPEWFNVYNRVDVLLTTHDAGGITQLDINMAQAMNRFADD